MAVFGTADAFFAPALTGLLPAVVAPERLQEANALRSLVLSGGLVIGPAIAGVLVVLVGPGGAIAFDAATFAASSVALALLRPRTVERVDVTEPTLLRGLREGFAEVRARPWVQIFLAVLCMYHVVVLPAIYVLGPVLAERELDGAQTWAIVTAGFGLGAILGNVLVLHWKPSRPLLVAAAAFVVASCQAAIVGSGLSVWGIAGLEAIAGVAVSVGFTLWETTLQEQIPERAISRVSSYDYLVSVGLMPVGLALAGPLEAAVGLHELLALQTAIAVPIALAALAIPAVRSLRRLPAATSAAA
jgi:predicted MFS family arabinose efflux permease